MSHNIYIYILVMAGSILSDPYAASDLDSKRN